MAEEKIGEVTHYYGRVNAAAVMIREGVLRIGDKIHIKGSHTDFIEVINSMQIENNPIEFAKAPLHIGLRVSQRVRPGDIVYKITEE